MSNNAFLIDHRAGSIEKLISDFNSHIGVNFILNGELKRKLRDNDKFCLYWVDNSVDNCIEVIKKVQSKAIEWSPELAFELWFDSKELGKRDVSVWKQHRNTDVLVFQEHVDVLVHSYECIDYDGFMYVSTWDGLDNDPPSKAIGMLCGVVYQKVSEIAEIKRKVRQIALDNGLDKPRFSRDSDEGMISWVQDINVVD